MSSHPAASKGTAATDAVRLLLIRHAEVEARYQRIFGGRIDMALSPGGHAQAQRLSENLGQVNLAAVLASPMRRVQQTLAPWQQARPTLPVTVLDELREIDFGEWTGLSWEEVQARHGVRAFDWLTELEAGRMAGAESGDQLRARLRPCLQRALEVGAGRTAAVFCHGGVIRVFLSLLMELPLPKTAAFDIDYASVSVVACHPAKAELQLLNYTPWNGQL